MGLLGGISDAKSSQGGNYIQPGIYLLQLEVMKGLTSRKGEQMFVSEWAVLESNREDSPPGSHVSWLANLTRHDAALGNVKACICGVTGLPEDKLSDDDAEEAIGEENPLAGRLVKCEAKEIMTRANTPFTKCFWHSVPDDVQAKAAELREKAGLSPF